MIFLLKEDIGDYSFPGEQTTAAFLIKNDKTGEQVVKEYVEFLAAEYNKIVGIPDKYYADNKHGPWQLQAKGAIPKGFTKKLVAVNGIEKYLINVEKAEKLDFYEYFE